MTQYASVHAVPQNDKYLNIMESDLLINFLQK